MNELNITLDYTNACRTNTSTVIRRIEYDSTRVNR